MTVERLTVFAGKYISVEMAEFPEKSNPFEPVKVTTFPLSVFKYLFCKLFGKRCISVPVTTDIPENLVYEAEYFNPYSWKVEPRRVRIVFKDLCGEKNIELASKVKNLLDNDSEIRSLRAERDLKDHYLLSIMKQLEGMNIQGVQDKQLLMALEISKEARKKLYQPLFDSTRGDNRGF